MTIASATLPDNGGYVAGAYLVFLALILIYVAIMAIRQSRFERDLAELNELAERDAHARATAVADDEREAVAG